MEKSQKIILKEYDTEKVTIKLLLDIDYTAENIEIHISFEDKTKGVVSGWSYSADEFSYEFASALKGFENLKRKYQ